MSERRWQMASLDGNKSSDEPGEPLEFSSDSTSPTCRPPSLVALSRFRANRILDDARAEARAIQQEAYETGLRQGREEARAQVEHQLEQLSEEFRQMARQEVLELGRRMADLEQALRQQWESRLRSLVVQASGRAWGNLLSEHPQALRAAVQDCLDQEFGKDRELELTVHPGRLELFSDLPFPVRVDPNLGPGDFLLQGTMGRLNGTLQARQEQLRRRLLPEYSADGLTLPQSADNHLG